MTIETILYKERTGVQTRDPLRDINTQDEAWLKRVFECYQQLEQHEPRDLFRTWWRMPNPELPRQTRRGGEANTVESFVQGILDKLNQAPNRRDLSPKQCQGIEYLSKTISEMYDEGTCPSIRFRNVTEHQHANVQTFNKLFK